MKTIDTIKTLSIVSKRWFDRTYGNTYHSCQVTINGEPVGFVPIEYGYDNKYVETALKILQGVGYWNTGEKYSNGYSKDYENFIMFLREHKDIVTNVVVDVPRKKDLKDSNWR